MLSTCIININYTVSYTDYIDLNYICCILVQESQTKYNKLEEALRKSSLTDLESGITLASEIINLHEMDTKLYLLRAKLSFKLVRPYYCATGMSLMYLYPIS